MKNIENLLFTEKYRPKNLEDLIVPQRIREKFEKGITTNMLLTATPGCGKTTAAKALVNQFNHPYLYINASVDTGIDIIRNRITDFCTTRSLIGDN